MTANRGLVSLLLTAALFLPAGGFSLAQEQQSQPETEESDLGTEQGSKEPEPTDSSPERADEPEPADPTEQTEKDPELSEPLQATEEEPESTGLLEEGGAEATATGSVEEDTQETESEGLIEEVTVTATRVETTLMKTPIAVTVLDQDTLNREGVQDIRDMASLVPNMDIATINGQSAPVIALRGVRSTNETELGDPAVGVHMDGVYSPRMQGILALMFDNERVEVLRGPQGTLFGRNSTVGNINIVTAKPQLDAYNASVSLRVGNYTFREVQGMVNIPVSKKLGFRFAGRAYGRDSYITGYWDPNQYDQRRIAGLTDGAAVIAPPIANEDGNVECTSPLCYTRTQHSNWWADEADGGYPIRELVDADEDDFYMDASEWAYRLSALWEPTKTVSLNLSWQRFRNESSGGIDLVNCEKLEGRPNYKYVPNDPDDADAGGVFEIDDRNPVADCNDLFPENDTYQAVVNTPGRFFLDINYLRSQLNWDIKNDLRLVFLGGFEEMERESAQDMDQSLNAWDQAMFFLPGTGSKSWSGEIQLQSYGAKKFNWIAGVNYFREKTSTRGYFDNALGERSLWDQPDRSTIAGAIFAQGTYSYSPKWHLTLGYRHSDETKEDKGGRTYVYDCNFPPFCTPGYEERAELNALPVDYFEDPANYTDPLGEVIFFENDNKGSWNHDDFRVGLDFQQSDNTLLYTYLATGFKAGGIGDVVNYKDFDGNWQEVSTSFGPEEVTTLEFGFKMRLFDKKLDLKGAYFYSDYEEMQYASVSAIASTQRWGPCDDCPGGVGLVSQPVVAYYTQNVPGARIQGFELEYDSRPWQGGRIVGYAAWLDTEINKDWSTVWNYDCVSYFGLEYDECFDTDNPDLRVNLKGNDLAVSPPFTFHVTVDHAFLLLKHNTTIVPWVTAHWEAGSYLTIWNVDRHTDLDFVINDEDIKYTDDKREAWSMVHAGVRFYRGNWSAELFGYNLTNEVVQFWGGAAENVAKGSFSMPRNYGFQVAKKFNF